MAGPYFPPLKVAGQTLAFDHLEPFVLEMATQSRPNGVKIDVRFSNHCFSETFDAARHDHRIGETVRARFRQQGLFQPRRGDKEDPQIAQFASSPSVEAKNIA